MKSKFFWGSAILCCALGLGTVSCSDDDDKEFSIEETFTKEGITTDYTGGIYKIKVNGNSEWEASVPDNAKWVNLVVKNGKGGQQVVILVEPKYDGISRNTELTVKSGSDSFKIPVKQIVSRDNATDGLDVVVSKGLGNGYNVEDYTYTSASVLNVAAIKAVMETDPIKYNRLLNEDYKNVLKAEDAQGDSLEDKTDTLGVKISCNISYGKFAFGVSGEISTGEKRVSNAKSYHLSANYPLYIGTVNLRAVLSAYNEWLDEGKPQTDAKGNADYRSCLIQSDFLKISNELEEIITADQVNYTNYMDNWEVMTICSEIMENYGPAIITKSTIGGSYVLDCQYDSTYTNETFDINKATVTAKIKAAVFELDAKVSVDYNKQMEETLKHANFKAEIYGGGLTERQNVYSKFLAREFNDKTAINTWAQSLTIDKDLNKNKTELINSEISGIWSFLGRNSQRVVMQYIADQTDYPKYPIVRKLLVRSGVIKETVTK